SPAPRSSESSLAVGRGPEHGRCRDPGLARLEKIRRVIGFVSHAAAFRIPLRWKPRTTLFLLVAVPRATKPAPLQPQSFGAGHRAARPDLHGCGFCIIPRAPLAC